MKPKRGLFKRNKNDRYQSKDMKKKLKKEFASRPPPTKYQKNKPHLERNQEAIQAQKRQVQAAWQHMRESQVQQADDSESSDSSDCGTKMAFAFPSDEQLLDPQAVDTDSASSMSSDSDSPDSETGSSSQLLSNDEEQVASSEEDVESMSGDDESIEGSNSISSHDTEDEMEYVSNNELGTDDEEDSSATDPYNMHTTFDLSPAMMEALLANPPSVERKLIPFGTLGKLNVELPKCVKSRQKVLKNETYAKPGKMPEVPSDDPMDWKGLHVKDKIVRNIKEELNPMQRDMFALLNNYLDCLYVRRSFEEVGQLRFVYCLHAMNHVLKAVSKIQHHNIKIATAKRKKQTVDVEYRDQGYVRPKVLIVVPFRESALQVVNILKQLFAGSNEKAVANYKRFVEEYGGGSTLHFPQRNPKPSDYERTFSGNVDDNFRLGIAFNRSSMKLYAKYYSSDVIVASPLGLRKAIGAPEEQHRDSDFLSSIEMLVIDQADVCYMQNWDHVMFVMENMHQALSNNERTEFSRVRDWCLAGRSKFYRQTLLLSATELPELRSFYHLEFSNYRGKVRSVINVEAGSIKEVVVPVSQSFQRVETMSVESEGNARFEHFIHVILPQARTVAMARCLIYVPCYFDFVRLRNYFKKEEISFTHICEYTPDGKIARARDMFYHGSKHILLYSERAHFFRRFRIKGIRHLIMYGTPVFPHFYPEMVNLMAKENQHPEDGVKDETMTVTVLYGGLHTYYLSEILGSKCAQRLMKSPRAVFWFKAGSAEERGGK